MIINRASKVSNGWGDRFVCFEDGGSSSEGVVDLPRLLYFSSIMSRPCIRLSADRLANCKAFVDELKTSSQT